MSGASNMVFDANVFVRLVVPGDGSEQAAKLWNDRVTARTPCWVPAFCPAEVISSLRQLGRAGLLSAVAEQAAVEEFITALRPSLIIVEGPALTRMAWEIARDLNERHTYDSVYLAIAMELSIDFWTVDSKLLRRLNGRIPQARFLGDYPLAP